MLRWCAGALLILQIVTIVAARAQEPQPITLRAWGIPGKFKFSPVDIGNRAVVEAFRRKYPLINPVGTTGIEITVGGEGANIIPFMQIAGDIAPDVLYVNFKQSQTYIDLKLLYPLDRY